MFENNEEIIEKFRGSVLILGLPGVLLRREWLIDSHALDKMK